VPDDRDDNPLLAAALGYAALGWRVVPLHDLARGECSCERDCGTSAGKHPRPREWQKSATTDAATIRGWWARWPHANVGVALGSASGIVAADVDPPNGEAALLEMAAGDLPDTTEMATGRGRRPLYAIPDGLEADPRTVGFKDPGGNETVRLQSTGGQCVMPPSLHYSGRRYAWAPGKAPWETPPAPMPGWMIAATCHPAEPVWGDQGAREAFGEGKDFNHRADWWRDILEPAGFAQAGRVGDVLRFTRPGKKAGISATVGHYRAKDGTPALYVFSGSIPRLAAGKAYDKFGAFAQLHHAGDFAAAAREAVRRGLTEPRKQPRAVAAPAAARTTEPPAAPKTPWSADPKGAMQAPDGVTAADLVGMDFPPPRFVIGGFLTEGLTVLAGRPKHGKSWLSLLAAWSVAAGAPLDGRDAWQGEVLYLALEDTRRRLKDRLLKLKGDLGWFVPETLDLRTSWPRADNNGLYHVADWLGKRKGNARLVIVDTLAKFRKPPRNNANSYDEDYEAVSGLKQLADQFGVGCLVVTHTRKQKAEDPFDEITGTLGISGAADTLLVLDTQQKGTAAKLYATGRDMPDSTTPMTYTPGSGRWVLGASKDGIDTEGRHADASAAGGRLERCVAFIKDYLRNYAFPAAELDAAAAAQGHAPSTHRDAKAKIGRNGTKEIAFKQFEGVWWVGATKEDGSCEWKRRPESRSRRDTESGESPRVPD